MADLTGEVCEVRFTLTVTRKETGQKDTIDMVGLVQLPDTKDTEDGSQSLDSST